MAAKGRVVSFCLLNRRWIPASRRSGVREIIRPADIASRLDDDPIVALEWPRPEQRVACLEFLIGLLATACPPTDPDDWERVWCKPPIPDELQRALAPFSHAFVLDGDGPRFMQDSEDFVGERRGADALRVETKRERVIREHAELGSDEDPWSSDLGTAAMALYTLQRYAGADVNAVGRGSVHVWPAATTLAIPPEPGAIPLWRVLWANVPCGIAVAPERCAKVFPWLARSRVPGDLDAPAQAEGTDPEQAFWAMPRRVRLEFKPASSLGALSQHRPLSAASPFGQRIGGGPTALLDDQKLRVAGWQERPVEQPEQVARSPLSPHWPGELRAKWLAHRGKGGGVGFRYWSGLLFEEVNGDDRREPAPCIRTFREERIGRVAHAGERGWRLLAAGYSPRSSGLSDYVCIETAVHEPAGEGLASRDRQLRQSIAGAADVLEMLIRCAGRGLGAEDKAKAGATPDKARRLEGLREQFWAETEDAFLRLAGVPRLADESTTYSPGQGGWLSVISQVALRLLADAVRPSKAAARAEKSPATDLRSFLAGYGPHGAALFVALGLPEPGPRAKQAMKVQELTDKEIGRGGRRSRKRRGRS